MTRVWKSIAALTRDAVPFVIRAERASDVVAREALLDASFGDDRHARTCQRLRDGRVPAEGLAFSAVHRGRLIGTVRLWHVSAGGVPALVLGPLAVDASCRSLGIGAALMTHALAAARARGRRPYPGAGPPARNASPIACAIARSSASGICSVPCSAISAWYCCRSSGTPLGSGATWKCRCRLACWLPSDST